LIKHLPFDNRNKGRQGIAGGIMKKHSFIFIIFVCIFLSSSYSQQKAEWKGTVEEMDGVKVIKNPQEPLFGEIEFELEEDLSIGREDDD